MATLTYGSLSYTVDHAVKGPNYVHGYDADGNVVVAFDGLLSFSGFSYTGTYMSPTECLEESCNDVRCINNELVREDGSPVHVKTYALDHKVGDIKTTLRTDLGDKWKLANGEPFSPQDYPKLAEMRVDSITYNDSMFDSVAFLSEYAPKSAVFVGKMNGRFVMLFKTGDGTLYVAQKLEQHGSEWTVNKVSGLDSTNTYFTSSYVRIRYIDGVYVYFNTYNNSIYYSTTTLALKQSTDLVNWTDLVIPVTPWTSSSSDYGNKKLLDIVKSDEGPIWFFTMQGPDNYYSSSAVVEKLGDTVVLPSSQDFKVYYGMCHWSYAHGKFFVVYRPSSSSTTVIRTYDIATKTWSQTSVSHSGYTYDDENGCGVYYFDGLYMTVVVGRLLYSTNGTTWTYSSYMSVNSATSQHMARIVYNGEDIVVFKNTSAVYKIDTSKKVATKIKDLSYAYPLGTMRQRSYEPDGEHMISLVTDDCFYETLYKGYEMMYLPTIDSEAYTYVKVEE